MDKYCIKNKIGEGGYGNCYLIESKKEYEKEILVAKVVNLNRMSELERNKSIQEIKILKMVRHPNIINLIESYTTDHLLCIIMEFGEYGSLEDEIIIRKNQQNYYFSEDEIMYIFLQVLIGTKYLHDNNIVHCDIKTNNIILFSDGLVKLTDFGISSILTNNNELDRKYSSEVIQGSMYYLAPEIYTNIKHDKKSDYWSIGCLLLELCSLEKLFKGYSIQELIILLINNNGKLIEEINCHMEKYEINKRYTIKLIDIIKALLNPEPTERININQLLFENEYILDYLKKFTNTIVKKNWKQFEMIKNFSNKNFNISNNKQLNIEKIPFWKKKNLINEVNETEIVIKQDFKEWFKDEERKIRNYNRSKSTMKFEYEKLDNKNDHFENKYKDIIDYFNYKREMNKDIKDRELSKKDILLQLETTVEFFATQLSSLNSRKVTTEEMIKRNLTNLMKKNNQKNVLNSNKNKVKNKSKNFIINRNNSGSDLKKELKLKHDKEREKLREIIRKGREETKINKNSNEDNMKL